MDFKAGDRVICTNESGDEYAGTVAYQVSRTAFNIAFDDKAMWPEGDVWTWTSNRMRHA